MKWSWKIGRIAGIDLRVHATFFILLAWLALVDYRETRSVAGAAEGLVFTLALFTSVVLHEFGHALTARRFGVPTRDITLLPIGGVARLEYIPDKPRQELAIALAGPIVTFAIAVALYIAAKLSGLPVLLTQDSLQRGAPAMFVAQLMWVNVSLLVFNLLPAFPMDGGRVLRALLALKWPYLRATAMAARVGKAFALLFGIVGVMYNPFLVLIALFVWLGAAAESGAFQEHSLLGGIPVERVMVRDVQTLAPEDTLDVALHHVLDGFQHDFPVLRGEQVVGVLTRDALLTGLAQHGAASRVADAMESSFRTAEAREPAERALARLRECHCHTLPVLAHGRLAGVVTAENVAEYVMIEAALRSGHDGTAAA